MPETQNCRMLEIKEMLYGKSDAFVVRSHVLGSKYNFGDPCFFFPLLFLPPASAVQRSTSQRLKVRYFLR